MVTVARPDIAMSINLLTRFKAVTCTAPILATGKRVNEFFLGTADSGFVFSPKVELEFMVGHIDDGGGQVCDVPRRNLFAGASIASAIGEYRSVTGALLRIRGAPILWKSTKHCIASRPTCLAEYAAAAGG